jgi:hypothetical protein
MPYRKDWGQPQQGGQGFARTRKTYGRTVAIGTTDNVTNNTVGAFMVPAGFVVTGIIAVATDMDSNGSPAMSISVGDSGSAARYLSASNIGQAGTSTTTLASTGLLYKNTVDSEVLITIATQAATAVAGTVDLRLDGYMDS